MTPILFEENETSFTTLGIGALTDAIMCKINRVLNGVDELTLQYPVDSKRYPDIKLSRIIYAQPEFLKDPQPYRIYYISTPLRGVITVFARHISEQRNYIPVKPFSASSISEVFTKLPTMMVESNPFTFWTDKSTFAEFRLTVPTSLGQVLGGMEGSVLDVYRGEYEFDKWVIKLWDHRGEDRGVTVRYGKNMTDFVKNDSIDNTITGIVPYWTDMDGNTVTLSEYVVQSEYADSYPFKRTVVVDFSSDFEEAPTETQLRSRAQSYITSNNIGLPTLSLKVSFEQLSQYPEYADYKLLDTTNLGDTIHVVHEDYNVSVSARVVETEYDCLLEKYKSVTIGSVKSSLEGSIKNANEATNVKINSAIKESTNLVRAKVDEATKKITGVDGGYVIMHLDANNQPYEILVMDTPDINTAIHVLRINMNGIGFSNSGYSGPYDTAWTLDGNFVADFITSGEMSADRISGGTLTLGGVDNGNGVLRVLNANGDTIGTWDKSGVFLEEGTIGDVDDGNYYDVSRGVLKSTSTDGTIQTILQSGVIAYVRNNNTMGDITGGFSDDYGSIKMEARSAPSISPSIHASISLSGRGSASIAANEQDGTSGHINVGLNYAMLTCGSSGNGDLAQVRTQNGMVNMVADGLDLNGHGISLAPVIDVTIPSFNSLPKTFYSSAINANHVLPRCGGIELSNPSAQTSNWTVTTADGSITISGSISGATTAKITLIEPIIMATASVSPT